MTKFPGSRGRARKQTPVTARALAAAGVRPVSWLVKTSRMYNHLKERGPVDFDLPRFRAWLACSAKNYGEPRKELLVWKCAYSGQLLTLADVVVDHRDPLSVVGRTTIGNLAICSRSENLRKGQIPHAQYIELRHVVHTWPAAAAADLWGRLSARKVWHVEQQKRAKDGAAMIDGFMANVRRGGK